MAEKRRNGKGGGGKLTPVNELAKDQQRIIRRNAAYAAAESKRRKKSMREALEMLMYDVKLDEQTKDRLRAQGIEGDEHMNHQMVITRSLIAKAEAGDVQAYNAICGMIGEKPADKVDMSGGIDCNVTIEFVHVEKDPVSSENEIED